MEADEEWEEPKNLMKVRWIALFPASFSVSYIILQSAVESVADAFNDIAEIHEEQPKHDWIPMVEKMAEQKGVLGAFPHILQTHAAAAAKTAELQRGDVLSPAEVEEVVRRNDSIGRTVVAEIEHFEMTKNEEIKETFKKFLREQINYQLRMQAKLKEAMAHFDQVRAWDELGGGE